MFKIYRWRNVGFKLLLWESKSKLTPRYFLQCIAFMSCKCSNQFAQMHSLNAVFTAHTVDTCSGEMLGFLTSKICYGSMLPR